MWYYIVFQTIILSVAATFIIVGQYQQYQSDLYQNKRKSDLYQNIGTAIIYIFIVDILAVAFLTLCPFHKI